MFVVVYNVVYSMQFMRELCAVWKWSVEERRGLFARDHTPSLGDTEGRKPIPTQQHNLIIQVLSTSCDHTPSLAVRRVLILSTSTRYEASVGYDMASILPSVPD